MGEEKEEWRRRKCERLLFTGSSNPENDSRGTMTSPSCGKFGTPMVRQLSLQNQPPLRSPASRGLRKQLSEDDSRVLESVGVTGQGWTTPERPELRIGFGGGRIGQTKITGSRPKPVKVAWADKKPEGPVGVEVIATKCQGQPRPISVKNQRLRSPLLGNKDTLVYTRLQLAERLRNAWSEREKMKPNINIFLARAPDTTRSENNEAGSDRRPGATAGFADSASTFSDPSAPSGKKRNSMKVRPFSREFSRGDSYDNISTSEQELSSGVTGSKTSLTGEEDKEGRRLQELNKIEIRMTKIKSGAEGAENKPPESGEPSLGVKHCRSKTSESSAEGKDAASAAPPVTAQDRRANYRRSSILHKTITESFSSSPGDKNVEETAAKSLTKPLQKKPPLVRAFSAPSQSDHCSDTHKAANLQKKVKMMPQRRLQPAVSFELSSTNSEDTTAVRERIKSAPVRRRLKSATTRRKARDKDSSDEDEEKETKESAASKKTTRRNHLKKGADIITMVSLVSPAASDTEDSVINLPIESWRGEEKDEPPATNSKAPGQQSPGSSCVLQKFVSLRKTTKSVTFQTHPVLGRGYSASFPSRRAPAGTPIIVPTPVVSNPALTPAQLLEREKRASVFSAINSDSRGIKRRLLRSSSEFPKEDCTPDEKACESGKTIGGFSENANGRKYEDECGEEKSNGEPNLRCPKERQCWNLYQKMLEKGVSVSFDTVLRGMLTPTEYRLRKNELLSDC